MQLTVGSNRHELRGPELLHPRVISASPRPSVLTMSATLRPFSGAAPPRSRAMSAAIPRSITVVARAPALATGAKISDPGKGRAPVMSRKSGRSIAVHGVSNEAGGITELREKSTLLVEKEDESAQIQVKKECNAGETSHDDTESSEVGNSLEPEMVRPLVLELNEKKMVILTSDGELIEMDAIVFNQLTWRRRPVTETDLARLESIVNSHTEGPDRAELDDSENINVRTGIGAQEKERTDALLNRLRDILKDTWIYQLVLYRRPLLLALVGVGAGLYIHFKVTFAMKRDYRSLAACRLFEFFGAKEIALAILRKNFIDVNKLGGLGRREGTSEEMGEQNEKMN